MHIEHRFERRCDACGLTAHPSVSYDGGDLCLSCAIKAGELAKTIPETKEPGQVAFEAYYGPDLGHDWNHKSVLQTRWAAAEEAVLEHYKGKQ